jgi:hypothetical protein
LDNAWGSACRKHVEKWVVYRVLVGMSEARRPLGRLRRRWKNNIKMDLREIG